MSTVKPLLTEENLTERVRFALSHLNSNGLFNSMYDHVHIDEKWFYITKTKRSYYVMLDEEEPARSVN